MIQYESNGGQVLPKCLQSMVEVMVTSEAFRTRGARRGYLLVIDHDPHQSIVAFGRHRKIVSREVLRQSLYVDNHDGVALERHQRVVPYCRTVDVTVS